jgi:hypothetical protein
MVLTLKRPARIVAVVVLSMVLAMLAAPDAAHAADPVRSTTLLRTTVALTGTQYPLVTLAGLSFTGGQHYLVQAQWTATSPTRTRPALQAAQVWCQPAAGGAGGRSVFTTRNHTGGTGYSRALVRWMFTAPATGGYTCTLMGHAAASDAVSGQYLTVVGGGETFLSVDRVADVDGQEWRQGQVHIATGTAAYVLRRNYLAGHGGRAIIFADVELTNNYDAGVYGRDSAVTAELVVVQVDAAGQLCGAPAHTYRVSKVISSYVHHDKVYTAVDAPKSGIAGCSDYFAVKLLVRADSGNPVIVEGGGSGYTNAIGRTR